MNRRALAVGASVLFGLLATSAFADAQTADGADEQEEAPAPQANPHGGDPHGKGGHGAANLFEPPEDGTRDDPSLPIGTLEMLIVDADGKPQPGANVTLGILYNSIAKGDSRKRISTNANDHGVARFEHLDVGSSVAYRPMVLKDGATFEVMPLRLPDKGGERGILHVYPVVEGVEDAMIVSQSVLYAEVKDDRIQIQQAFKVYNFGKSAWVPKELFVALPPEFTAFTSQQGMTDITVDAVQKQGVRVRGTFGPGQHMIEFRWQLPYSGEAEVNFDVGVPPHMAASRVMAPASKDMRLEVAGFPAPQSASDGQGQRALITEKQLRRDEPPIKNVSVTIKGLPTEGPGKFVATFLAAGGLVFGLVLGAKKPGKRDRKDQRQRLLAELEELERARLASEVGPKTYERSRRELLDALAKTFAEEEVGVGTPTAKARTKAKSGAI
jgi:hypothetical protein